MDPADESKIWLRNSLGKIFSSISSFHGSTGGSSSGSNVALVLLLINTALPKLSVDWGVPTSSSEELK